MPAPHPASPVMITQQCSVTPAQMPHHLPALQLLRGVASPTLVQFEGLLPILAACQCMGTTKHHHMESSILIAVHLRATKDSLLLAVQAEQPPPGHSHRQQVVKCCTRLWLGDSAREDHHRHKA